MRYAIYFTPGQNDPLARIAASWLGRDPFTGAQAARRRAVSTLSPAEIAFHTACARRYGFHATLKAPFQLADGETEAALDAGNGRFCRRRRPDRASRGWSSARSTAFSRWCRPGRCPRSTVSPTRSCTTFDRFRAPLTEAEIERRNPDALSPEEFRNLCQWGYPYVFDASAST